MADEERIRELQQRVEGLPSIDEGLAASKQLVEELSPMAASAPAKYQQQLATAWKFRGIYLGLTEAQGEAEEAFATAVRMFRDLATETNPETLVHFAIALQDLAHHQLKREGGEQEALAAIQEARDVCQRFAEVDPDLFKENEANLCHLHATASFKLGDYRNAIAYAEQAEKGLRRMEMKDSEYRHNLAENHRILGLSLIHMDRVKDGRKKLEEAAYFFRRLSKKEPELYSGEFANATFLTAMALRLEGKETRAVATYEYAAELYAKALEWDPSVEEEYQNAVNLVVEGYLGLGNHGKVNKIRRQHPVSAG